MKVTSPQKNRNPSFQKKSSISIFSSGANDLYARMTFSDNSQHEEEDVHSTSGKLSSRS